MIVDLLRNDLGRARSGSVEQDPVLADLELGAFFWLVRVDRDTHDVPAVGADRTAILQQFRRERSARGTMGIQEHRSRQNAWK